MPYSQVQSPDLVFTLDLTTARVLNIIVPPGVAIGQVYVATLPAGADFRLRFGVNNPPVPTVQTLSRTFFTPLLDGLAIESNAQPGLTAVLTVVLSKKTSV